RCLRICEYEPAVVVENKQAVRHSLECAVEQLGRNIAGKIFELLGHETFGFTAKGRKRWLERPSDGQRHRSRFLLDPASGMYKVSDELQFVVEIEQITKVAFSTKC